MEKSPAVGDWLLSSARLPVSRRGDCDDMNRLSGVHEDTAGSMVWGVPGEMKVLRSSERLVDITMAVSSSGIHAEASSIGASHSTA